MDVPLENSNSTSQPEAETQASKEVKYSEDRAGQLGQQLQSMKETPSNNLVKADPGPAGVYDGKRVAIHVVEPVDTLSHLKSIEFKQHKMNQGLQSIKSSLASVEKTQEKVTQELESIKLGQQEDQKILKMICQRLDDKPLFLSDINEHSTSAAAASVFMQDEKNDQKLPPTTPPTALKVSTRRSHYSHKFSYQAELGAGAYGRVIKVHQREPKGEEPFAIKIVNLHDPAAISDNDKIGREVQILTTLHKRDDARTKFIVKILDHWAEFVGKGQSIDCLSYDFTVVPAKQLRGLLFIQMEFCDGGDLYEWIQEKKPGHDDEQQKMRSEGTKFFTQVTEGLTFLHDAKIMHRDMKPKNILLTRTQGDGGLMAKIGDFGASRLRPEEAHSTLTNLVGTDFYRSPEQLNSYSKDYTMKTDIYSMGVILFEIYMPKHFVPILVVQGDSSGRGGFHDFYQSKTRHRVPKEFGQRFSKGVMEIIQKMLSPQAHHRPSARELLDWCKKEYDGGSGGELATRLIEGGGGRGSGAGGGSNCSWGLC